MTDAERAALIAALQACRVAFAILQDAAMPAQTRIGLAAEGTRRVDSALVALGVKGTQEVAP